MSKLHILDASVFLKAGTHAKHNKNREIFGFPVGGIEMLLNNIVVNRRRDEFVVVVFDSKTDRKELLGYYKGNRQPDFRTLAQEVAILPRLQAANIPCIKRDSYEADDLIDAVVRDNIDHYDKIYIHTNDMDLARNVTDKVEILCPTTRSYNVNRQAWLETVNLATNGEKSLQTIQDYIPTGVDVNRKNWEYVVREKTIVMYNTLTTHKTLLGDSSDNVPALPKGKELYANALTYARDKLGDLTQLNKINGMAHWLVNGEHGLTKEEVEEVFVRMKVFYPRLTQENLRVQEQNMLIPELKEICQIFRLYDTYKKMFQNKLDNMTEEQMTYVRNLASDIKTGMVAIQEGILLEEGYMAEDLFGGQNIIEGENIGGL